MRRSDFLKEASTGKRGSWSGYWTAKFFKILKHPNMKTCRQSETNLKYDKLWTFTASGIEGTMATPWQTRFPIQDIRDQLPPVQEQRSEVWTTRNGSGMSLLTHLYHLPLRYKWLFTLEIIVGLAASLTKKWYVEKLRRLANKRTIQIETKRAKTDRANEHGRNQFRACKPV